MPLIPIQRKPSNLQGYQLISSEDMFIALEYMSHRDYTGTVNCYNSGGIIQWSLSLQDPTGGSQQAVLNDWLVLENDTIATLVPEGKAGTLYEASQ